MTRRSFAPSRRALLIATVVTVAFAMACVAAPGRASAAPLEPTLNLAQLQTLLNAGPVPGYFKTVDQGSHIATIPMTVISIIGNAKIRNPITILIYVDIGTDTPDIRQTVRVSQTY